MSDNINIDSNDKIVISNKDIFTGVVSISIKGSLASRHPHPKCD